MGKHSRIMSLNFVLGFFSNMSFFLAIYYLTPVLPIFLRYQGFNNSGIGLGIGVYSLAAIFFRAIVGRLSIFLGHRNVMLVGALISVIASPLYLLTGSLPILMLIRVFHGAGTAVFATSSAILVAEISPQTRLAESIGIFVTSVTLAMGLAPIAAILMMKKLSFTVVLIVPSLISLISALLVTKIKWPVAKGEKSGGRQFLQLLKDRDIYLPSLALSSCSFSFGTIMAFIPLYVLEIPEGNVAQFFVSYSLAVIFVRVIGISKLADRFGRLRVIIPAMLAISAGVFGLGMAKSSIFFVVCSSIYGVGYSLAYPTLNATVLDHVPAIDRDSAISLFATSADLGAFLGPLLIGLISQRFGFSTAFLFASLVPLVGAILFWFIYGPTTNSIVAKGKSV